MEICSVLQIRMARAALGWTLSDASERSGVSIGTIRRAETNDGFQALTEVNRKAITTAFTEAGIIFTGDAGSPGVQLVFKPR